MISLAPLHRPIIRTIVPPGDKSITHRALFFGALNTRRTIVRNPSSGDDVVRTRTLLERLGYHVGVERGAIVIDGTAPRRARSGRIDIDCGNSGTTARLAMGFLTGERGIFTIDGDASLRRRPMERVAVPLRTMGALVSTHDGRMPLVMESDGALPGGRSDDVIRVESAQVHAAVALAALRSTHGATVYRATPMRDHTLRIMDAFGIAVRHPESPLAEPGSPGLAQCDIIKPAVPDRDVEIDVPGDFSSAAYFVAAGLIVPDSHVRIDRVGLNPSRIALLRCLRAMNASVTWTVLRDEVEPSGRIDVRFSTGLRGVRVGGDGGIGEVSIGEIIDELPLLALLGARAWGTTVIRGAHELRTKESDRIRATVSLMRSLGVDVHELDDGFELEGPQNIEGGIGVRHHGDHRLCMLAGIASLIATQPVFVHDPDVASVSYPGFWSDLENLRRAE